MFMFRKFNVCTKILGTSKFFSTSNLFVPRDKATSLNAFLTPCLQFDFEKIDKSIKLRNLKINLCEIKQLWDFYNQIDNQKNKLENERKQIAETLKTLVKHQENDNKINEEINRLKMCGKFIRDELKMVKEKLCALEYDAVTKVLDLPNILHSNTPIEDEIVFSHIVKPTYKAQFHLEIGTNLDLIEYYGPYFYYLKDDAALLELTLMDFCKELFLNANFIPISNADFVRSIVAEGCGVNSSDNSIFTILENSTDDSNLENRLHLAGGSSVMSFMAFHTKNLIHSSLLPLRYFNIGRFYEASFPKFYGGLFNVHQSTNFDIFIVTSDSKELYEKEFQNTLKLIEQIYKKIGYHFQIVYKSAKNLKNYESFRVDFEMYSTFFDCYINVGHLSMSDAYYSQRLMFQYLDNEKLYPKIISGTVINYAKLLGCILEQKEMSNLKDVLLSDEIKLFFDKL